MEPDKTPLVEENHFPNHHFQVPAVNLRGCKVIFTDSSTMNICPPVGHGHFFLELGLFTDSIPWVNYHGKKILDLEGTPWKINIEPTNRPFRKENDLPNLHDYDPC